MTGFNAALQAHLRAIQARSEINVPVRVDGNAVGSLARSIGGAGSAGDSSSGGILRFAGALLKLSSAAASLPAVISIGQEIAQMGPAAAVAIPAVIGLGTAFAAWKLSVNGLGSALAASGKDLRKYPQSIQEVVKAVKGLGPAWARTVKSVQSKVFEGLGKQITQTGKVLLPQLRKGLEGSAETLNKMGSGVLTTARNLGTSGAFGQAINGANQGLGNLTRMPGQFLNAIVKVGAAAAPAWNRMTAGMAKGMDAVTKRLDAGFKSGGLEKSIDTAIQKVREFGTFLGNVGTIIGNIFGPASDAGVSFFAVLSKITAKLAEITSGSTFQSTLREVFTTLQTIGQSVGAVLGTAFRTIGPLVAQLARSIGQPLRTMFETITPAIQRLVSSLGPTLGRIFDQVGVAVSLLAPIISELVSALADALAPVLKIVGNAIAELVPVVAEIVAQLASALIPIIKQLAPVVATVASAFVALLMPVLKQLPAILAPILAGIQTLIPIIMQLVNQALAIWAPYMKTIGQLLGELATALAPLIGSIASLAATIVGALLPVLSPILSLFGAMVTLFTTLLVPVITGVVIPIITALAALLRGDFSGALNAVKTLLSNVGNFFATIWDKIQSITSTASGAVVGLFKSMGTKAWGAVKSMGSSVADAAAQAMKSLGTKISDGVGKSVDYVKKLPGKAKDALGDLGSTLIDAGKRLIGGFIDGIKSMFGSVKKKLGALTDMLPDWKGPAKRDAKILTPAGRLLIRGFIRGIDGSTAQLRSKLQSITKALPAHAKSGVVRYLKSQTSQLNKLVTSRDGVLKKLDAAEKKLSALRKKWTDARNSIRDGILGSANITQGGVGANGKVSTKAITDQLKAQVAAAKKFAADLAKLKKKGLDADLLAQIANAGVDKGGVYAATLAKSSAYQIKTLNKTQTSLEKYAKSAGDTTANALFGAGVHAAEGLVKGLKSKEKVIESQMLRIAKSMERAIKRALGIHSPSRVMAGVGKWIPAGLVRGIESGKGRVDALMSRLVPVPELASVGYGGLVSGGPATGRTAQSDRPANVHIENYHAGSMTPGQVARELEWRMKARG
ncbi:hypothetical protein AB0P37_08590 [Streptomyces antimycoticus]|uniref:hypothetical protein n=1 Tax=Streptomyces antimycoticus TaxID=68175 RepID=UPI0034283A78